MILPGITTWQIMNSDLIVDTETRTEIYSDEKIFNVKLIEKEYDDKSITLHFKILQTFQDKHRYATHKNTNKEIIFRIIGLFLFFAIFCCLVILMETK